MTAAARTGTDLRELRRELHRHPEVGLRLPWTQQRLLELLAPLGLEITTGRNLTSIVAVLRGGRRSDSKSAVLLRADMDGLPVTEASGEPYAATGDTMHACGHDLHLAALIGAAELLAARRDALAGDVVFMFQPGEEAAGGALAMLGEHVLDAAGRRVEAVFGAHVFSYGLSAGTFAIGDGAVLSGSSAVHVVFAGRGGHGSAPHLARDPIPAACEFEALVQAALAQQLDMRDDVVLTFGQFHAGTRDNVLPDEARLGGTLRTFSVPVDAQARAIVERVANGVAAAHGIGAAIEWSDDPLPTVNDPAEAAFARAVGRTELGEQAVAPLDRPFSVSEDFARVLRAVPGVFVLVGATAAGADPATAPANHSAAARFDDAVVLALARLEAAWAQARLKRLTTR